MNANLVYVPYKQMLDLWTEYCGLNSGANQPQADKDTFNRLFCRVAKRAWDRRFWPDLMNLEERHYRDDWTAQAYASGAEVYHTSTDKYWTANAATISTDVPGVSSKWTELTTADTYIAYDQTGKTPLGGVKAVWSANFRTTRPAYELPFVPDERGITLTGLAVPRSAWVHFRTRCPVWRGVDYVGGNTYASGRTVYFTETGYVDYEGDYWTSLAAISTGESPRIAPTKWKRLGLPTYLSDFVVQCAKLGFLEGDGQLEKALAADGSAWASLYDAEDSLQAQGAQARTIKVRNI